MARAMTSGAPRPNHSVPPADAAGSARSMALLISTKISAAAPASGASPSVTSSRGLRLSRVRK